MNKEIKNKEIKGLVKNTLSSGAGPSRKCALGMARSGEAFF
jgi:hypothetical protein